MVGLGQKRPKMLDHDRRCRGRVGEGRWEANIIVERSRDEKDLSGGEERWMAVEMCFTGTRYDRRRCRGLRRSRGRSGG
jgi:hypothetical protein